MKNFNASKMLLTLLSIAIVSAGCSKVTVTDKEACADLGGYGARCAHTYTDETRDVSKAQWDAERVGWICMHPNDFLATEDSIDELCRTYGKCDYQIKDAIDRMKKNMRPIHKAARQMRDSYGLHD